MKLSEIARGVQVGVDKDLTAADLEILLAALMTARSKIEPAVHPMPPTAADAHTRSPVVVQRDPDITFAALADGGIRLWLRHAGAGWLAVQFSAEKARLFRDYLIKWVPGAAPVNLINDHSVGGDHLQ